jgi:hypothetical protein
MGRKLKHGDQAPDYSLNDNREIKTSFEPKPGQNKGLQAILSKVKREDANVELEGGETVLGDITGNGTVQHGMVVGKSHDQGGVPLKLPEGTFVFSNTEDLRIIDPEALNMFGMEDNKGKGYTPAEIAKKFEINKFQKISDDIQNNIKTRKSADRMLEKNFNNLFSLATLQEGMKAEAGKPKSKKVRYKLPEFEEGGTIGDYNKGKSTGGHWNHRNEEYTHFEDYIEAVKYLKSKKVDLSDISKESPDKLWNEVSKKLNTYLFQNKETLPADEAVRVGYLRRSVFKGAMGIKNGLKADDPNNSATVFAQEVIANKPERYLDEAVNAENVTPAPKPAPAPNKADKAKVKVPYAIRDGRKISLDTDEDPREYWESLSKELPDATRVSTDAIVDENTKFSKDEKGNYIAVDQDGNILDVISPDAEAMDSTPEIVAFRDNTRVVKKIIDPLDADRGQAKPEAFVKDESLTLSEIENKAAGQLTPEQIEGRAAADSYQWDRSESSQKKEAAKATSVANRATSVSNKATSVANKEPATITDVDDKLSERQRTENALNKALADSDEDDLDKDLEGLEDLDQRKADDTANAVTDDEIKDTGFKEDDPNKWWTQDKIALAGAMTDSVTRFDPTMQQVPIELMRFRSSSADARIAARQSAGESTMDVIENTSSGAVARANAMGVSAQIAEGVSQDQGQVDGMNAQGENQVAGQNAQLVNQGRALNANLRDDYTTKMATVSQNYDNSQRVLKNKRLKALMNGMTNADNTQMLNDMFPNMAFDPGTGKIGFDKARDIDDPNFNSGNAGEVASNLFGKTYQKLRDDGLSEEAAIKGAELSTRSNSKSNEQTEKTEAANYLSYLKNLRN